ncbi:relaxase [Pseudothauera nasutitermitis]|uniref:Relaxase n=2 Tax=Betaproteobacteria TaxID=28216 RepID=A0A3M6QUR9_9BURK|nr:MULTISPECIES: MobH family relaxase [Betaproteobacteria]RMX06768.1 relaxase [Corticibacter populi]RZS31647.1 integrating conjugative element relaxase (TIGR03760 family) [Corticibacter populi]THF64882.1 relaxase [Pseudothauera nasutitermitis]
MLSLFQRKRTPPAAGATPTPAAEAPKGLTRPQSSASLLATPRRQRLLEHIWQRTSLSRGQFAKLYLAPLERYAELVQQFPASESHHHAYPGGMLDHGLEIVAYALKLRQAHLLPVGTPPEDQAAQAEVWTAAGAYAALLHDIGKIAVDLHVELVDGTTWHPWHGPLQRPYRFRYREDREYRLHGAATGLLYHRLLDREILDWLSGYPGPWASLLYVLAGQYEHAGVLGELVVQADRASVAQELGGDPTRALAAPKTALQRKLLDGLRYLLKQELKLNQPEASDGWLTRDALWLVSKTVSDKLRAHLLSLGVEGIPANNTAIFNVLQEHGMLQPTPDGKAIWRATIASDKGWSHTLTLLRLAPALVWDAAERPEPFMGTVTVDAELDAQTTPSLDSAPSSEADGPASADARVVPAGAPPMAKVEAHAADMMDDLLSMFGSTIPPDTEPRESVQPVQPLIDSERMPPESERGCEAARPSTNEPTHIPPGPSAEHFLAWLQNRIQMRKLIINDARALVHTVAGTAYLVSPGVFQRYAQEHPQVATLAKQEQLPDWRWMQKRFERLQVHRKQPSGLNIWTCDVSGPRKTKRVHGYLLDDPGRVFSEVPPDNPYLSLSAQDEQNVKP